MSYCTRSDIEQIFEADNVSKWADLADTEDATAIAARIALAIEYADMEVDDHLRGGPYAVPITGAATRMRWIAAQIAGIWLYEVRGVRDFNEETGQPIHRYKAMRESTYRTLNSIRNGVIRLDATPAHSGSTAGTPFVVRC